ncbi:MAG: Na/Pi cotransporter family protein [Anaerolineae bacterium]
MDANIMVLNLVGGISLLLYGMHTVGRGMQRAAGARMRRLMGRLTANPLRGMGIGALVTATLQSSSATTVMLVGFVSTGILELEQTLGVILGADIGTTITVQLIAFNIVQYSVLLIAIGVPMMLATKQRQYNYTGQVILGFGFVFLAMKLLADSMAPLKEIPLFQQILLELTAAPLLTLIFSGIVTVVIQSSAGMIGLAIALSTQGLIPLSLAIPIIFGANIGTSATALLSSIGTTTDAQRVAIAHALFKVVGVVVMYPFMQPFANFVELTSSDLPRQIANAHTLFNLGLAILILPFTRPFAWAIRKMVPERREIEEVFRPKYIDQHVLDSPALAIGQATREALRMADIVQGMLRDSILVLRNDDEPLLEEVIRRDDRVDLLEEEIKRYLTQLSEQNLPEELSHQEIGLLYAINDMEHIGDIISKSLLASLARKKIEGKHVFSEDGMAEIEKLHGKVSENLELAVAAFAAQNRELAEKVLHRKAHINQMERELRQAHIQRLRKGLKVSIDTSAIHLDVLNDLKRINSHATNVAYVVLGEI